MSVKLQLGQIDKRVRRFQHSSVEKNQDERRGREDGRNNSPADGATNHPYAAQLRQEARQAFTRIAQDIHRILSDLDAKHRKLLQERDTDLYSQRENTRNARDDALDGVERRYGEQSDKYRQAEADLEDARTAEKRLRDELGRPCKARLPLWAYLPLLAVIALCELPINQGAFSQIVPGANAGAGLVALLVGIVMALAAHVVGDQLRQAQLRPGLRRNASRYTTAIVITAVMGGVFYGISLLRQAVLRIEAAANASIADGITADGLVSTFQEGLSMDGWSLFAINMVIYGAGVLISWLAHDPHDEYPRAIRRHRRCQRRMSRLRRRLEKKRNAVDEHYDPILQGFDNRLTGIAQELEDVAHDRTRALDHWTGLADIVAGYVSLRIATYEAANQTHRTAANPAAFGCFDEREFRDALLQDARFADGSDDHPHLLRSVA